MEEKLKCENCKHWKPLRIIDYKPIIDDEIRLWEGHKDHENYTHQIERAALLRHYGTCSHPKIVCADYPTQGTDELVCVGDNYYDQSINCWTGKDFGCIHCTPEKDNKISPKFDATSEEFRIGDQRYLNVPAVIANQVEIYHLNIQQKIIEGFIEYNLWIEIVEELLDEGKIAFVKEGLAEKNQRKNDK